MKKRWAIFPLTISIILLFNTFSSIDAEAGEAGVGVMNVPPQYSMIRLVQQNNSFRAYLTVSDYNSWEDIYSVSVILEDSGVEKAEFLYKQYADLTSYEKINEFSEIPEENKLLVIKKCSYDHSYEEKTVEDKCNLEIIFVFHTTWFSGLQVIATDREGSTATLQLDYTSEDIIRSDNIIIIPGLDSSMSFKIPPYLLDFIALLVAAIGTLYFVKKTDIGKIMRAIYEKN